ncbi:MAG TPA: glucoamylase family protein [Ohtaekwangia sp.]|nr:glucoamylase family protein [Ohtaekwangia sp.]
MLRWYVFIFIPFCLSSCDDKENEPDTTTQIQLSDIKIGTYKLNLIDFTNNNAAPVDKPIVMSFSTAINENFGDENITLLNATTNEEAHLTFAYLDNGKTVSAKPNVSLQPNNSYQLRIENGLKGNDGESFPGYSIEFTTVPSTLGLTSLKINEEEVLTKSNVQNIPLSNVEFEATFSHAIEASVVEDAIRISGGSSIPLSFTLSSDNKTLVIKPNQGLAELKRYQLVISDKLTGTNEEVFNQFAKTFYTTKSTVPDFPLITDEALLTLVQQQTFKYFWDFAQPNSGMARERNTSGDLVTSGGSGFGLMAMVVGIERGFISRDEGLQRLDEILTFLEGADRFHGAWSHWINGNTGKVIPFSANDNGGDLVETALLVQGLLTFRQYLNPAEPDEAALINRINVLWQGVEWDWYTKDGEDVLYWHWSPDKEWVMNHQIRGHNETLITYVLAAASPTHTIDADVYQKGYARNGAIQNGKTFYDITLPLGEDYGGPLFFSHYSFLGLDPRSLEDNYANYWTQNVNHTLINQAYAIDNPKNYVGYGDENWGLTASDNHKGYSAHSPLNDLGVITPTAALSSFPYTPEESMKALKFFYYIMGDKLWGDYGFYDAFNLTEGWVADSYLAIDQGPIIIMIENYRTGLLWNLFMSAPEVQSGLDKLDFNY